MEYLFDENIPVRRGPNPVLDKIAEKRQANAKVLFLTGAPLSVVKRAQEAITTGAIVLQLIGTIAKLSRKSTVRLSPGFIEQSGLSQYQIKRSITALTQAGLISCKSSPGKRREITIIDDEYLAWLALQRVE